MTQQTTQATSEPINITLRGRLFVDFDIHLIDGLHIGGRQAELSIGGVDNPIIRDPITLRPYIPGSSLRGKMRSEWEKAVGAEQNTRIGQGVNIHSLKDGSKLHADPVCRIFGVTGDVAVPNPTRLIVHDVHLGDEQAKQLETSNVSLYAEIKFEAAIDRVTSAATPRQQERVPAGTIFHDGRLVYNVFTGTHVNASVVDQIDWFFNLFEMLQMVEDTFLGGYGSRGSGRVRFSNIRLSARFKEKYTDLFEYPKQDGQLAVFGSVAQAVQFRTMITEQLIEKFNVQEQT